MRSKTMISSSKRLEIESLDMIKRKCKKDHFNYQKQLPLKKNHSSYTTAYKDLDIKQINDNRRLEEFRKKVAPPLLDTNMLKRSLHQSSLHFSRTKVSALPNLRIGSTYQSSYLELDSQKIQKAKQQNGHFIKMPWHDSPSSNYKKSFENANRQIEPTQKGKAVEDNLIMIRRPFKGQSMYGSQYSPLNQSLHSDSKDCIKNKDHMTGGVYQLCGKSEYKSRFQKSNNKQKEASLKSIKSTKSIKKFNLPEIKPNRVKPQKQNLPKKSLKMKITLNNPVNQVCQKSQSTHARIFGALIANQ